LEHLKKRGGPALAGPPRVAPRGTLLFSYADGKLNISIRSPIAG
jgi:hypothetical protein